jgi:hypothetical protein
VWLRLANAGQRDVQRAGNDLNQPLDEAAVAHEVLTATDIIQVLEALRAGPALLARVVDAIKVYERDILLLSVCTVTAPG